MLFRHALLLLALIAGCTDSGNRTNSKMPDTRPTYPPTERIDHVDTYHGVDVPDPYRWLEDLDSEETARWVAAQNALSEPFLEAIPERDALKQRLTALWNYERYGLPFKEANLYFYQRNDGLQNQGILYVAEGLDEEPRVLIDPNRFRDDATAALAGYEVSPDARYIAYGVSDGGSDWKTWHVRDIETGEDLPDSLRFMKFSDVSWTRDGDGFYYSRYPEGSDGDGDDTAPVAIYYHTLGTPQAEDPLVYRITDHATRTPYGNVTDDGRYLVIQVFDGYDANAIYYRDRRDPDGRVVRLLDDWDALYTFLGNEDTVFYFQTTHNAPRGRVIAVDLEAPSPDQWREIIPEAEETLEGTGFVGGRFAAEYLKDARSLVKVFDPAGTLEREVDLPGIGTVSGFGGHADDPETFYAFTSFTRKPTLYRYDIRTGSTTRFREAVSKEGDLNPEDYGTRQVFVTSKDGTRVPMFIVHKNDLPLDGHNPTLLYGYGGFNISLTPGYNPAWMAWLERGGVLAIPNLRGGGEYGEAWHQAGTKLSKQNVFDDFIAAAEWLIDNNYTSPQRLAAQGGSNGGLLVGAAITQRPDLFGAALPAVGVLDMLRYHTASANARQWSSDYGLSENEDEFRALYAYSPYHNVRESTCYPATLVTTADHDDRVVPWHSFKFAAALQHTQRCDNPALIRIETRAGHGAGTPTWMRIENTADQWAFLFWALGF